MPDTDHQSLVNLVYSHYEDNVTSLPEVRDYLCRFRIDNPDAFNLLHLGYSNRTLNQCLPSNRSAPGHQQRSILKNFGILSAKGHERFAGCLTMAIKDKHNQITQIVGYKIKTRNKEKSKQEVLLNSSAGIFNQEAISLYKEVILCESLFNAMLFIQSGFLHVISLYGDNGCELILNALKKKRLQSIVVALPNTPFWSAWKSRLKAYCVRQGIAYYAMVLPGDLDISRYYLSAKNPTSCFLELIRRAKSNQPVVHESHRQTVLPKRKPRKYEAVSIEKYVTTSESNKKLVRHMSNFIEWTAVKGHSKDTCRRRASSLARFIHWCEGKRIQRVQDITSHHLQDYQRYLHYYRKANGEPLTKGSQYSYLTPITTFFKYLKKRRHILSNPALEMELPKKSRRLPRVILNPNEMDAVMEQPNTNSLEGIRDRAILEVLYASGIRRCEVAELSVFDIDYHRELLCVNEGKDNQDYFVPLGGRPIYWITQYLTHVRPLYVDGDDEGTLFLNHHGKPFKRSTLAARVKGYMKKAGIEVKGSCHLFRHAMATHMLDNGADIRYIQEMLGHSDIASTQVYTKVSIEKLREVHARTHPMTVEHFSPPE